MDVEDAIRQIVVTQLFSDVPAELIDRDAGLRSVIGLDSLGFTELRVQCESEFGILISDEDFNPDNFHSVGSLAALVRRLTGAANAGMGADHVTEDAL